MAGQIDMMIDSRSNSLAAGARRHHQGLCRRGQEPLGGRARHSDGGRGGIAGVLRFSLVRAVGAQGHAEGRHRQAQCRGRGCLGRSGGAPAARRPGQEIFPREQQTPEALGAFHKAEIEKWWPIIKAANIKAE